EVQVPARAEPADDRGVEIAKAPRDTGVQVRTADVDGAARAVDVPAVPPAVAVRVGEVVGLPRVRRQNDRDPARAERTRTHDEGGVTHAVTAGGDADEVQAARPVADPDADGTRRVPMPSPGKGDRRGHRPRRGLRVLRSAPFAEGVDIEVEVARI